MFPVHSACTIIQSRMSLPSALMQSVLFFFPECFKVGQLQLFSSQNLILDWEFWMALDGSYLLMLPKTHWEGVGTKWEGSRQKQVPLKCNLAKEIWSKNNPTSQANKKINKKIWNLPQKQWNNKQRHSRSRAWTNWYQYTGNMLSLFKK